MQVVVLATTSLCVFRPSGSLISHLPICQAIRLIPAQQPTVHGALTRGRSRRARRIIRNRERFDRALQNMAEPCFLVPERPSERRAA
ncbi:MAG: hypothetical protein JWM95_3999 [Gemmatimonadetes bacterium]|nr:hypothetical protein [Gemmatimonadota bacterium]